MTIATYGSNLLGQPDYAHGAIGGLLTADVTGYGGERFSFSPSLSITGGEHLWLVVKAIGPAIAIYRRMVGPAQTCLIGNVFGTS